MKKKGEEEIKELAKEKISSIFQFERYLKFCSNRSKINEGKGRRGFERHHLLPKCLFPEYKSFRKFPWNKVLLTTREHYLAHYMLIKSLKDEKGKLEFSFNLMCNRTGKAGNSYLYEARRTSLSKLLSSLNTGRKLSEENRERMREYNKGKAYYIDLTTGETHHIPKNDPRLETGLFRHTSFGKKHKESAKIAIGSGLRDKLCYNDGNKVAYFHEGTQPEGYELGSLLDREAISERFKGFLWYNKKGVSIRMFDDDPRIKKEGWNRGRIFNNVAFKTINDPEKLTVYDYETKSYKIVKRKEQIAVNKYSSMKTNMFVYKFQNYLIENLDHCFGFSFKYNENDFFEHFRHEPEKKKFIKEIEGLNFKRLGIVKMTVSEYDYNPEDIIVRKIDGTKYREDVKKRIIGKAREIRKRS